MATTSLSSFGTTMLSARLTTTCRGLFSRSNFRVTRRGFPIYHSKRSQSTKAHNGPNGSLGPQGRRSLLITFDAFDTLYTPRTSVAQQYIEVGKAFGFDVKDVTEQQMQLSIERAIKEQRERAPNYADSNDKSNETKVQEWWAKVIKKAWEPFLHQGSLGHDVSSNMVTALFDRFRGKEGYRLFPDAQDWFDYLRKLRDFQPTLNQGNSGKLSPWDSIVVGVISNGDGRVADVLRDLGLQVASDGPLTPSNDVDFVMVSAMAGYEKPDPRIWRDAKKHVQSLHDVGRGEKIKSPQPSQIDQDGSTSPKMIEFGEKVHIGDSLEKDHDGAVAAGWTGILLDRNGAFVPADELSGEQIKRIPRVNKQPHQSEYITVISSLSALKHLKPHDLQTYEAAPG